MGVPNPKLVDELMLPSLETFSREVLVERIELLIEGYVEAVDLIKDEREDAE